MPSPSRAANRSHIARVTGSNDSVARSKGGCHYALWRWRLVNFRQCGHRRPSDPGARNITLVNLMRKPLNIHVLRRCSSCARWWPISLSLYVVGLVLKYERIGHSPDRITSGLLSRDRGHTAVDPPTLPSGFISRPTQRPCQTLRHPSLRGSTTFVHRAFATVDEYRAQRDYDITRTWCARLNYTVTIVTYT